MAEPEIAQLAPYETDVEHGETYYWCACGKSKKQPFCDGSHADTDFTTVSF
ncbi:MAG: CDGSH iron-sulfur domain-containing protein, partial [Thiohalomonadales bacterium]